MSKKGSLWILAVVVLLLSFSLAGLSLVKSAAHAADNSITGLLNKGKNIPGFSYDYIIEQTGEGASMKITGKTFISGQKTRNETTIDNHKMIVIADADANVMYNYDPSQNTAMKISLDVNKKGGDISTKYTDEANAVKMKVIGTATYEGVKCTIVQIEGDTPGETTKMWLREDYGLPMKIETTMGNGKMTMEYKNMKIGAQPAELFKLPPGVNIMDMSEMMKNIPPTK